MQSFSKHFANLLPAVLVFSEFRLRRVFSGSVHYSWVHCHLASVSLDFASLIYRVWLRLRFGPSLFLSLSSSHSTFQKHHIDSSVMRRHALYSLLSVFLSLIPRPPASLFLSTSFCGSRKKTKTRMKEYF